MKAFFAGWVILKKMDEQSTKVISYLNRIYPLKLFTDLQKEAIASNAPVVRFEEGSALYQEGKPATDFFMILSGQVRLTIPVYEDDPEGGEISLGDLEPGDLFGLEALEEGSEYLANAISLSALTVVRFNLEFIDPFFEENAIPYSVLMVMLSSWKLFMKLELPWRNPEEAVLFIARRHLFFLVRRLLLPLPVFMISLGVLIFLILSNLPGTILVGVIAGLVALITGLWAIWNYIDWTNDYSILTNQRVVFLEKVILLYDNRMETPLDAILSTSVDSTQFGRILGYGDVVLKTYTGTLIFPDLAMWETVRLLIDDRRARARDANLQAEKQTLQNVVRQRLRLAPPAATAPLKAAKPEDRRPSLAEFLANVFRMRSEKSGVITYRTHWFILMRRMFFPGLALIGVMAIPILRFLGILSFFSDLAFWAVMLIVGLLEFFWLWYRYEDWANDIYIVSDEQIVDIYKRPLGQEEKRMAPLKSIQSVEFERLGIIGLFLNYGTVFIRIGDTRFTFDEVYNPSEVQRDLFRRIAAQTERDRRKEAEDERQRILDVLEAYHEVMNPPPPSNAGRSAGESQKPG
jgi:hypothetical protein